jgi:hypothetical protein
MAALLAASSEVAPDDRLVAEALARYVLTERAKQSLGAVANVCPRREGDRALPRPPARTGAIASPPEHNARRVKNPRSI